MVIKVAAAVIVSMALAPSFAGAAGTSSASPVLSLSSAPVAVHRFQEYTLGDVGQPGVPALSDHDRKLLFKIASVARNESDYLRWSYVRVGGRDQFAVWSEFGGSQFFHDDQHYREINGPCNAYVQPSAGQIGAFPDCSADPTPPIDLR